MNTTAVIPQAKSSSPLAAQSRPRTVELLARRRSTPAAKLTEPGPTARELSKLFTIAARVPDHGKLAPWRFVVFEGEARARAGEVLVKAWQNANPHNVGAPRLELERTRFTRAPVVVMVVSTAQPHAKIPEWEQILSAGAVCQNLLIAAHAMGYAGQWLTEWYAYDRAVLDAFGLDAHERVAGFIYLGSTDAEAFERPRPDVEALMTRWGGA